uniref:Uncharacterized protein n=1 Tax=Anguilla anguilla TaxID=7936 RepID=A0A0E9WFT6_ANGAN
MLFARYSKDSQFGLQSGTVLFKNIF